MIINLKVFEESTAKMLRIGGFIFVFWFLLVASTFVENQQEKQKTKMWQEYNSYMYDVYAEDMAIVRSKAEKKKPSLKMMGNQKWIYEELKEYPIVIQETKKSKGFPEYEEDTLLLARIIDKEAGNTYEDKVYVASVVINRARTNYRDFKDVNEIADVLYQGYLDDGTQQYATATIKAVEKHFKPSKEALKVAKSLISGEIECLPEEILFQTTNNPDNGNVTVVDLKGSVNVYAKPNDFQSK